MSLSSFTFGTHLFDAKYEVLKSVTLQMTNFENGNNKFYLMEIHEAGGKYRLYSAYGRTGSTQAKEERIPTSLAQAESEFDKIKRSKEKKGYVEVKMVSTSVGSDLGNAKILSDDFKKDAVVTKKTSVSNINEFIKKIVSRIYDEAGQGCTSQLNGSLEASSKNPLGTLSTTQIKEGKDILLSINALLSKDKKLIGTIEPEVLKLTNAFYSAIPQEIPLRPKAESARIEWMKKYALNNAVILDEKSDLLDLLGNVKGMIDSFSSDDVGEKYKQLECEFQECSKEEFAWAKNHLESNQSSYHNWKLEAVNIWKVNSKAQSSYRDYITKIGNIQPLFHGSRAANIMGICKKGLLQRPPGAYVTGSMFGSNAIYFANQSTKSSQYATARFGGAGSKYGNTCFMFIADVGLGKIKEYQYAQQMLSRPPDGYDSVKGVKGPALLHDEHMIYDIRQNQLKYLIEFRQI